MAAIAQTTLQHHDLPYDVWSEGQDGTEYYITEVAAV